MSAQEMYDYLDTITAGVDYTLGGTGYAFAPQGVVVEQGSKNQVVHQGDDGSEQRVGFSDDPIFYMGLSYEELTESEAGALIDLYYDPAKANARRNSFKFYHIDGPHTYVVRFDMDMERARKAYGIYGVMNVRLRVLGRIADA